MPEQDKLQFPEDGIVWRVWGDDTVGEIAKREQPILLFVADPDPFVWPFLREIFQAMPANKELRELLHSRFVPLFIKSDELPEELKALGAGSSYHIAILSPYCLTPMVTFNPVHGSPVEVVEQISQALEHLAKNW